MKRLIMVRHAKTIQYGYDQDFERTLTERGQQDAEKVCRELMKVPLHPDLIIASPAVRTTQTAGIFADLLQYPAGKIRYEKKLYSGMQASSFIRMVQELDDTYTTVMVVGHNPTIYYFIDALLPDFSYDVPTCSTLSIEFDASGWSELQVRTGVLTHRWTPVLL